MNGYHAAVKQDKIRTAMEL